MISSLLVDRLKRRLADLGISERQACLKAGLKPDGLRTIRNGHAPRLSKLRALADALDVPLDYLTEGAPDLRFDLGRNPIARHERDAGGLRWEEAPNWPAWPGPPPAEAPPGYVYVPHVAVCDAPDRGRLDGRFDEPVLFPEQLIHAELGGAPTDFIAAEVGALHMSPVVQRGDRILIDRRQTSPVRPGIFSIDEGLGFILKWVEFLPAGAPPRLRIRSENPRFEPYEVAMDAIRILGRVVWFARCLQNHS